MEILEPEIKVEYEFWHKFLEEKVNFTHAKSSIHTKDHCRRVLLFALLIAQKKALNAHLRSILAKACVFHDSRRFDDGFDVGHGDRAAAFYQDFCQKHHLAYDNLVSGIMAYHDRPDVEGEKALKAFKDGVLLYHIFKDADALDRYRFGALGLDPRYLRTKEALALMDFVKSQNQEAVAKFSLLP